MPLQQGPQNYRKNIRELMKPVQSLARRKAIATLARKRNISKAEAQAIQARAIARTQAQKG